MNTIHKSYVMKAEILLLKVFIDRATPYRAGNIVTLETFLGWKKSGHNIWCELIERALVKYPKEMDDPTPYEQLEDVLHDFINERGELYTFVLNTRKCEYPADIIPWLEDKFGTRVTLDIHTWTYNIYDCARSEWHIINDKIYGTDATLKRFWPLDYAE